MPTHDLVIVGGGPAGLTAGLYAARALMDVVLLERLSPGGQVLTTDVVENWPGDVDGVSGFELSDRMRDHALKFGLKIKNDEIIKLASDGQIKVLTTPEGEIRAKAVILAVGAQPRKLGVPGEDLLIGKGVSYCGTCDGPFYREQTVVCFGGGDTAAEEAVFLTRFAKKVYLVHRRDQLRAAGVLAERVLNNPKIEVLWSQVPLEIKGQDKVEAVRLKKLKDEVEYDLPCDGAFVFVGTSPNTGFLRGVVDMDREGFIIHDRNQHTSMNGVFAAGDCCSKLLRQIVVAAGEGAVATYAAQRYLEEVHE
ncbi:MAG: thioredoxin-disulfide reductase [Proteobacteria bacterium]|nr:thioredoxin-disulfide reductase [Pseudomonadota bacterium]MBU1452510.1 thioredoxin-disulfide reductase [Pseudomonadota bacterium]MBU2469334.1 thioredoxin-disulfide reductase [Pseudomonadota bacterium]MBU2518614.1 thioredoxin-disulfide reductase [Pseudomonadota bacterium]